MDEEELRIGKKRRSTNPAIALAEEAVRMQHEMVVELRKKAARVDKDEASKKATTEKDQPLPGEQGKATGNAAAKRDTPSPERTVPRPIPTTKFDIEA